MARSMANVPAATIVAVAWSLSRRRVHGAAEKAAGGSIVAPIPEQRTMLGTFDNNRTPQQRFWDAEARLRDAEDEFKRARQAFDRARVALEAHENRFKFSYEQSDQK